MSEVTISGLRTDDADAVRGLLAQLERHKERNWLRSLYYDAKRRPRDTGMILPPAAFQKLGAVLGWPAKAVDAVAQRTVLTGMHVDDEGLQADLQALAADNMLEQELHQTFISSMEHGVAWLLADVGDAASNEPKSLLLGKDALNATGTWDRRRRGLTEFLSITRRYPDNSPAEIAYYVAGQPVRHLVRDQDTTRWKLQGVGKTRLDELPAEPLPYQPRTGRPLGSSRISRPIMGIVDMAVRTVVRAEVGAEFFSTPQRWAMGADESAFGNANTWQILLGRMMMLDDDDDRENPRAQVGQFPQISMQPHMDQLRSLAQLYSGEASIPVSSLGISIDSNPTSADSYAASREDIIALSELAHRGWRPYVERSTRKAMALRGARVPDDVELHAQFRDPRYTSRAAQADALQKQAAIMPWLAETEVAVELLGYDEVLTKRLKAERLELQGSTNLDKIAALAASAPQGEAQVPTQPASEPQVLSEDAQQ